MAEPVTGVIVAAIDTDIDNLEAWNRWYDREHLAPNVALPGVVSGHRYVATPELHASRRTAAGEHLWRDGLSTFLTVYFTTGDPVEVIAAMTERRDELEATGRMDGAGRRVVRIGDAAILRSTWSDPDLRLDPEDPAHVVHAGLRVRIETSPAAVASGGPAVLASLRFDSALQPGRQIELQLLDRPATEALETLRTAVGDETAPLLDAGFEPIVAMQYGFIDDLRRSSLPRTIDQ
jgi:hypothetical protein